MKLKIADPISQRDSKWANTLLGFNKEIYTIGTDGCLLTSVTHYLKSIGFDINPKQLNEKMKDVDGFTNGGWWVWEKLNSAYPEIKLSFRSKKYVGVDTPDSFFNDMRKALDLGHYLILEVDFSPSLIGEQMHWVGVYGYEDKDFLIMDPWTGTNTVLSIYGEIKNCTYSYSYYDIVLKEETQEDPCIKLQEKVNDLEKEIEERYKPEIQILKNQIQEYQNDKYPLNIASKIFVVSLFDYFSNLLNKSDNSTL